jgi:dynein heavy chain, axonemal
MESPEGEKVSLGKNLKARGAVEEWLMAVQDRMQKAVRDTLDAAVQDYEQHDERTDWVCNAGHPGQCVATAAQVMWSKYTEEVLGNIQKRTLFHAVPQNVVCNYR